MWGNRAASGSSSILISTDNLGFTKKQLAPVDCLGVAHATLCRYSAGMTVICVTPPTEFAVRAMMTTIMITKTRPVEADGSALQ